MNDVPTEMVAYAMQATKGAAAFSSPAAGAIVAGWCASALTHSTSTDTTRTRSIVALVCIHHTNYAFHNCGWLQSLNINHRQQQASHLTEIAEIDIRTTIRSGRRNPASCTDAMDFSFASPTTRRAHQVAHPICSANPHPAAMAPKTQLVDPSELRMRRTNKAFRKELASVKRSFLGDNFKDQPLYKRLNWIHVPLLVGAAASLCAVSRFQT